MNKVEMIVDMWERYASDRKTLVFCNSIKHAEKVWREFIKRGHNFELLHSKNDNRDCIERLQNNTTQGIVNVSITIAGFDCPDVSCIVDARPSKIERVLRQAIGRGRRTAPNKVNNIHLDFANYYLNFGATDDDRYYVARPVKDKEPLFVICPECGAVNSVDNKECEICGYNLAIVIEQGAGKPQPKKALERLVLVKSMQDEMYARLRELVKERGHKAGFSYYLFRELLMNAKTQNTGITYYSKLLRRIEKCKERNFKLKWLSYQ